MKIFGFPRDNPDAEIATELREASLGLTLEELDNVIAFLQSVQRDFAQASSLRSGAHRHLRDWSRTWRSSDGDLVILYTGQRRGQVPDFEKDGE